MRKSLKLVIIGSYLGILTAFILVYLAVHYNMENRLRSLYIERQQTAVEQTIKAVDEQVRAAERLCLEIAREPYVQYFVFADRGMDQYQMFYAVKLVNQLGNLYSAHPFVADFYIYYGKSGRIANGNSFYTREDFYEQQWACEDLEDQERLTMAIQEGNGGFLPGMFMKNGSIREEMIPYVYHLGSQRGEEGAAVVILLKKSWLDERLAGFSSGDDLSVRISQGEEEIYSLHMTPDREEVRPKGENGEEDYWEIAEGPEGRFLVTGRISQETGWSYEVLTPYRLLTDQTRKAMRPFLAGLAVCLLAGIPACLLMARKSYGPIHQLADHVENLGYGQRAGDNEIEYIRSGIQGLHEKYQELEAKYGSAMAQYDAAFQKLRKNKERIQEEMLRQLMGGFWEDHQEIQEKLKGMDIEFPYEEFCTAAVEIESREDVEDSLSLFIVRNIAQEILEPVGRVYTLSSKFASQNPGLLILVNLKNTDSAFEDLKRLLEEMKEYIRTEMKMRLTIGLGEVCRGLRQLPRSGQTAEKALEYSFVLGKGKITSFEAEEKDGPYQFDEKKARQLLNYVAQRKGDECGKILRELYEDGLRQKMTVGEGKLFQLLTADLLIKAIGRARVDREMEEACQDMVAEMLGSRTLPEMIPIAENLLERLCRQERAVSQEELIGKRAVRWIEENYWKPNFSLQMCADALGVSPEHLSRSVKQEEGKNFTEIVNKLRIDRAKELLENTDKRMEDIALMVGFGTVKSFFRTFKQMEGMPPGAWRRKKDFQEATKL